MGIRRVFEFKTKRIEYDPKQMDQTDDGSLPFFIDPLIESMQAAVAHQLAEKGEKILGLSEPKLMTVSMQELRIGWGELAIFVVLGDV